MWWNWELGLGISDWENCLNFKAGCYGILYSGLLKCANCAGAGSGDLNYRGKVNMKEPNFFLVHLTQPVALSVADPEACLIQKRRYIIGRLAKVLSDQNVGYS